MKRVIVAAITGAALFLCLHRPASAMVEFCPAGLQYERVGSNAALIRQQSSRSEAGKSATETSSTYALELTAFGARTVSHATLTFDTSGGWYSADVPALTLIEKDRHYTGPSSRFVREDYVSPVFYVRFPQAVTVNHGWVSSAAAQGDSQFDWDKQGTVHCAPAPRRLRLIAIAAINTTARDWGADDLYKIDPNDIDPLTSAPQRTSIVLPAIPQSSAAPCAHAFEFAMVTRQAQPDFPQAGRGHFGVSTAEVAIDDAGHFVDAWIWGPSGQTAFDEVALRVARASSYIGGRAYCKPAPGYYLIRVTFDPNG
ncbi:MAG TPA: energy transducer TonB [Candidatus Baltobacteraceae bacterium]|nr:energy transducer TonB [Candidatus Baltobacteraceae bacterium]